MDDAVTDVSENRQGKLPATTDQQQGKTGTSSDDINPTSPGRHTAYSKGVNTTDIIDIGGKEPERFYAYVTCMKTDIIHLVRTHEADFTVELNDAIGPVNYYRFCNGCVRIDCK